MDDDGEDGGMIELAGRRKQQPPPPWAVFEALTDPGRDPTRPWLLLEDDEVAPRVLEAERPGRVVWSSLWADRPDDQVHFELEPAAGGCWLRWSLRSSVAPPSEERLRRLRYRLNVLINNDLRSTFDQ